MSMLRPAERRQAKAFIARLKDWDTDSQVRNDARPLPTVDAYVLPASDDYWIFFRKEADTITVSAIASKETIDMFATAG